MKLNINNDKTIIKNEINEEQEKERKAMLNKRKEDPSTVAHASNPNYLEGGAQ
jgi:hypothetical protein